MSSSSKALITPSVIKWARERAKLSIDEAAIKIGRPPDDIRNWEDGSSKPSIAQARKAAKAYRRPLALFYLAEPPTSFSTLRDFRLLPDHEQREYSPELALLIRTTRYRQEWIKDYLINEGVDPLPFVGSHTINSDPRNVALDILKYLEITPDDQISCQSRYDALLYWLRKTELAGIYVFRQREIELSESRGFILSDNVAPFIYINSDDSKAAQIFTLAHELAHLWIDKSGVSNNELDGFPIDQDSLRIEVFCNNVASEAVLEESSFSSVWNKLNHNISIDERISKISGVFNISEEVVARRLLDKGIVTQSVYRDLRRYYGERWLDYKLKESIKRKSTKSSPSYYVITLSKTGYAFSETVIGAFLGGSITGRDASSLLNVKTNNIHKLGEAAGML